MDGEKEQVDTLQYLCSAQHLVTDTPDFATLTSHSFLHKLPTRGKLICLLFYERAFHFSNRALSRAVFTLLEHAIGLCWFNIWRGLIQFSFLLYIVQLDLPGRHIPVSALVVSIIFHVPLGFRDDFKFLSHLLWLFLPPYMLAWFCSFIIHSSGNQSTNIFSVPALCQSLWQKPAEVFVNNRSLLCF